MTHPTFDSDAPIRSPEDDSIDLLRLVAVFTSEWRIGLLTAVLVFAAGAAYIAHLPSRFVADTLILPKEGAPAGGTGNSLAAIFTAFRPTSPYLTLLGSRGLQNDVIQRANLLAVFHTTSLEAARGALAGMTGIIPGADGTYDIRVRDEDAALATRVANTYVDSLRAFQQNMALQQAEVQRSFFEAQLKHEKDALAAAEADLQHTQEGSGIVDAGAQTSIGLSTIAGLRSQITAQEVHLATLLQSETEQNPEVQTARAQLAQLQAQERAQESQAGSGGPGSAGPASRMPRVNLEIARKQREVQFHLALVTSLANHFEEIRMGEGNSSDNFDVIDRAVVPETATWPPRRAYLLLVGAMSVVLGLIAIALAVAIRRLLADAAQRENLRLIRHSVRRRRARAAAAATAHPGGSL